MKLESGGFDEVSYVSCLNETLEQFFVAHSQALENAFEIAEPSQQSEKLLNQYFVDSVQARGASNYHRSIRHFLSLTGAECITDLE